MFNERIKSITPGSVYDPKFNLVEKQRYHGTAFGYGNKVNFTIGPTKEFPGPGTYKLPTIIDKFYSK